MSNSPDLMSIDSDYELENDLSNVEEDSSDDLDDIDSNLKPGFPIFYVNSFLKNISIEDSNIVLFDNIVTGVEIFGFLKQLNEDFIIQGTLHKNVDIKQQVEKTKTNIKISKIEIDEDDENENDEDAKNDVVVGNNNNSDLLNRELIILLIDDPILKNSLTKLIDAKKIVSVVGILTMTTNEDNSITAMIKVNNIKQLPATNNKKQVTKFIQIKTLLSKTYLSSKREIPNPWWDNNKNKSRNYNNDINFSFFEWLDANPLYNRYSNFMSTLGINTWIQFKSWITTDSEKYRAFINLLKEQIKDEAIISKFINDTMEAIKKYT